MIFDGLAGHTVLDQLKPAKVIYQPAGFHRAVFDAARISGYLWCKDSEP